MTQTDKDLDFIIDGYSTKPSASIVHCKYCDTETADKIKLACYKFLPKMGKDDINSFSVNIKVEELKPSGQTRYFRISCRDNEICSKILEGNYIVFKPTIMSGLDHHIEIMSKQELDEHYKLIDARTISNTTDEKLPKEHCTFAEALTWMRSSPSRVAYRRFDPAPWNDYKEKTNYYIIPKYVDVKNHYYHIWISNDGLKFRPVFDITPEFHTPDISVIAMLSDNWVLTAIEPGQEKNLTFEGKVD